MAILGTGGTVELNREWPLPAIIRDNRIAGGAKLGLDVEEPAFWSGDKVLVFCERGVPFDTAGGNQPDCPSGYSFYGTGPYIVGPAITARTSGNGFYGNLASANIQPFYERAQQVGLTKVFEAYVHRDAMDNLRFYSNEIDAINGDTQGLVKLFNVAFGKLVIAIANNDTGYRQFLANTAAKALSGEITVLLDEQSVSPLPDVIEAIVSDPEVRGWKRQCDLNEWVFEVDAGQLDQTSVGDTFGEYAKGLLSGSGSFAAEVANDIGIEDQPSSAMLKLLTLTARGAKASARFLMGDGTQALSGAARQEKLYYQTDILFFRTQVTTAAGELIRLRAEFIATGQIRVVSGKDE
jgi:hypothetical protein